MNFKKAVSWLESRSIMPQSAPSLAPMKLALQKAKIPMPAEKVLLVAGTNGKGTTAKTLEQLLTSAGQNVGLYTSPHLISTCERIRIKDQQVTETDFSKALDRQLPVIESLNLTHFESLTLMAADLFAQNDCDWMIFEVGLGGLWDATNALPHNTSILTTIGRDHIDLLGPTLLDVAKNKFGIIQQENLVIAPNFQGDLQALFLETLVAQKAQHLTVAPLESRTVEHGNLFPTWEIQVQGQWAPLSLPGQRTVENTALALTAFKALGYSALEHVSALEQIQWPGRLSQLVTPLHPQVYLSGDHNPEGIQSLVEALKKANYDKLHLVFGTSKNRNAKEFLKDLSALNPKSITLTQPLFQGQNLSELSSYGPFMENPMKALELAMEQANHKDLVVVTGSLYLCGDILSGVGA